MHRILRISSKILPIIIEFYSFLFRFRVRLRLKVKSGKYISVINTHSQGGGAARVALDIVTGSRHSSEMHFFVNENAFSSKNIYLIEKMKQTLLIRWLQEMERIGGWLDFSLISPLNLLKNSYFQSSKIVHLHNLHGSYFSYAILSSLVKNKKVIWTLHDEQLLTGHCSCTLGCDYWKKGCGNCPFLETYPAIKKDTTKELLAYKTSILKEIQPTIVCPSHWLADRVKVAFPFLKTIKVIPNGVDINVFKPMDKKALRTKLGLPENGFILLFAAELATNNPFKGGAMIEKLIETNTFKDTYFVTIGGETMKKSENHLPYGYITEQNEMAELYAASDLMLYPTRADNLPLVVLEAMSCGLPVVSTSIGGIKEIIKDKVNGFLIADGYNSDLFKEAIDAYRLFSMLQREQYSIQARKTIVSHFSIENMLKEYDKLYNNNL